MSDPIQTTDISLKSGFLSSEFATMVIAQVVGVLVMSGRIQAGDASAVTQQVSSMFVGITMIITAVSYIYSRLELKKTIIQTSTTAQKV